MIVTQMEAIESSKNSQQSQMSQQLEHSQGSQNSQKYQFMDRLSQLSHHEVANEGMDTGLAPSLQGHQQSSPLSLDQHRNGTESPTFSSGNSSDGFDYGDDDDIDNSVVLEVAKVPFGKSKNSVESSSSQKKGVL
jgi:hypothetical protein